MMRPAIAATRRPGVENFYFLADYHALIKCQEPGKPSTTAIVGVASGRPGSTSSTNWS